MGILTRFRIWLAEILMPRRSYCEARSRRMLDLMERRLREIEERPWNH